MKIKKKNLGGGGGGGEGGRGGGGGGSDWGGSGWKIHKKPEDQWSCKRSPDILA